MHLGVLTDSEIQRIHEATLEILESTGVSFKGSRESQKVARECGCRVDNERIRFPRELTTEYLRQLPDRNTVRFFMPQLGTAEDLHLAEGASHFGIIGNPYYIYDYELRRPRDVVEADLPKKLLIYDNLNNLKLDCCNLVFQSERQGSTAKTSPYIDAVGTPESLLRQWVGSRRALSTESMPISFSQASPEETRLICLGHSILQGTDERIARQLEKLSQIEWVWANPISPLRYHHIQAEAIVRLARSKKRYRLAMICPEVMMGATGPMTMAGTLVQHNSEVLAGTILAQMAGPGTPVIYGCVSAPMDLRSAEIAQGNIETALLNAASVQLANFYGMPSRLSPGNTSAREPGVRAAVEAALGIYIGASTGGNIITTALLDSTLMVSFEHLVLVDELVNQLGRSGAGIMCDAQSLAVEVIDAAGMGITGFLESSHTMEFLRRDVYFSEYCGRIEASYEDWYEKAHRRVADILGKTDDESRMTPEQRDRLTSVLSRMKEDDVTWRENGGEWWRSYVGDFCP